MLVIITYECIPEGVLVELHGNTTQKTSVDMTPNNSVDDDL